MAAPGPRMRWTLTRAALLLAAWAVLAGCCRKLGGSDDGVPGDDPPPEAQTAPWPSFRGDPAMTGVAASALPEKLELVWTFDAGDSVESTAAIVAGVAYVGVADDRLVAIDMAGGRLRWEYETKGSVEASPCVAGGKVFVGDAEGVFHAVDAATGRGIWTFETRGQIPSSANCAGDSVLVGSYDSSLYCLVAGDGKL